MRVQGDMLWPGADPVQSPDGATGVGVIDGGFDLAALLASLAAPVAPAAERGPLGDAPAFAPDATSAAAVPEQATPPTYMRTGDVLWSVPDRGHVERAFQAASPESSHASAVSQAPPASPELPPTTAIVAPSPSAAALAPRVLETPSKDTPPVALDAPLVPRADLSALPAGEPAAAPAPSVPTLAAPVPAISQAMPSPAQPEPAPATSVEAMPPRIHALWTPLPSAGHAPASPAPIAGESAAPARRRDVPTGRVAAPVTSAAPAPMPVDTPAAAPVVIPVSPTPRMTPFDDHQPASSASAGSPAVVVPAGTTTVMLPHVPSLVVTLPSSTLPQAMTPNLWRDVPTTDDGQSATVALVETMRWQRSAGGGTMQVRLRPEHFGEVTVTVQVQQGHVAATLSAESPAAIDYLHQEATSLREMLHERGLVLDRFEIRERDRDSDARRDRQPPPETPQRRSRDGHPHDTFEVVV